MIGQRLGHYRIESQLGAGGMGVVYRAHDETLDRTVAIKVVGERLASEPTARERLLREACTASALNHPHVCTVHEVGEADGQVFIVMEGFERVMRQLNQATLDGLKEDARTRYVSPFYFAVAYSRLGDKDEAFAWLEKAAVERSPWVTYIKGDPDFDGVRSDPRFTALLKRIGLAT